MRQWLIPGQCLLMKPENTYSYQAPPEWTMIRGVDWWATGPLVKVQVASVWRPQWAHLPQSPRVTALIRIIQSRLCKDDEVRGIIILLSWLCTLWRLFTFQAPLSMAIISQLMSVLANQRTLFIFIKVQNGNFPKTCAFLNLFRSCVQYRCDTSVFLWVVNKQQLKNLLQCFILQKFPNFYMSSCQQECSWVCRCVISTIFTARPLLWPPGCVASKTTVERLYDISPASVLLLNRNPASFTAIVTITLSNSSHAEGQGMQVSV